MAKVIGDHKSNIQPRTGEEKNIIQIKVIDHLHLAA